MVQIKISGSIDPIRQSLGRLQGLGRNPHGLLKAIGNEMVDRTRERVERGRTPAGTPFAALNPLYAKSKRGPGILIGRGGFGSGLMGSLTHATRGNTLVWGSNKVYAAIHQFGGVIRPKNKNALTFRMGGQFFTRKSVTMPARPYLGFNREDQEAVLDTLETFLGAVIRVR